MTSLDEALLKHLKDKAKRLDRLTFIKWMLDNFIVRNYNALVWVCELCELPANADLEQIYTKLNQNANNN